MTVSERSDLPGTGAAGPADSGESRRWRKTLKRITNLKMVYIVSLLLLATLFVLAVFKPFATGASYTQISRQSLLHNPGEWILQFDLFNHEGHDVRYSIQILFGGNDYREDFVVKNGGKFTYIHHIPDADIGNGQVTYRIYKEDGSQPFEQATYYLK